MKKKYFSCINHNGEEGSLAPIENFERHKVELNATVEYLTKLEQKSDLIKPHEKKLLEELKNIKYKFYWVEETKEK